MSDTSAMPFLPQSVMRKLAELCSSTGVPPAVEVIHCDGDRFVASYLFTRDSAVAKVGTLNFAGGRWTVMRLPDDLQTPPILFADGDPAAVTQPDAAQAHASEVDDAIQRLLAALCPADAARLCDIEQIGKVRNAIQGALATARVLTPPAFSPDMPATETPEVTDGHPVTGA